MAIATTPVRSETSSTSGGRELPAAAASRPRPTGTVPGPAVDLSPFTAYATASLSSPTLASNPMAGSSVPRPEFGPAAPKFSGSAGSGTNRATAGTAAGGSSPTAPVPSTIPKGATWPDESGIRPMTMAPAPPGTGPVGGGQASGLAESRHGQWWGRPSEWNSPGPDLDDLWYL